jgi:hypothetical protein
MSTLTERKKIETEMNRVQELIDENKEHMPTGLAKRLLDACKAEADAKPKLYRATVTRVTSVTYTDHACEDEIEANVKLQSLTQTLIVEKVDRATLMRMPISSYSVEIDTLLNKGIIPESWVESDMPMVFNHNTNMHLVHSIEPYVPKRAREE